MNKEQTLILNNEIEALSNDLRIDYHGRAPSLEALEKSRKDASDLLRKTLRFLLLNQLKYKHVETLAKSELDKQANACASSSLHRILKVSRRMYMKKKNY